MKKNNRSQAGPGARKSTSQQNIVVWVGADKEKTLHVEPAGPALLHRNIHQARRIRTGVQYKGQRNYHGLYAFGQTGQHVWYESLFEKTALLSLDFSEQISSISAQPVMLQFPDRSVHYPDFFAVHDDGRQVLYDVRPSSLTDKGAADDFAKTKVLCDLVGWRYELFTDIDPLVRINLEWLAGYKHPRYIPTAEVTQRVLRTATSATPFRDLVRVADPEIAARGSMALYNLLWNRQLTFDMTHQLNSYTPLTSPTTNAKDRN
jgi:hypothetical protein